VIIIAIIYFALASLLMRGYRACIGEHTGDKTNQPSARSYSYTDPCGVAQRVAAKRQR
jgi:hypothetical protein